MSDHITPETTHLFDQLAVNVLTALRQHDPVNADALYVTFVARSFLDVCRDNQGPQLDMLVSLINHHVDAPVSMTRRVQ